MTKTHRRKSEEPCTHNERVNYHTGSPEFGNDRVETVLESTFLLESPGVLRCILCQKIKIIDNRPFEAQVK